MMGLKWLTRRRDRPAAQEQASTPASAAIEPPRAPCGDEVFRQVREARRTIYPSGAALDLLRYLQREHYTGWLDLSELQARWAERHEQLGLSTLRWDQVCVAFKQLPEVRWRRCRVIGTPDYAEFAARMKRRGKLKSKHTIFWVPDHVETDEAPARPPALAAEMPVTASAAPLASGHAPPQPPLRPVAGRPARPLAERCTDTVDMFASPRPRRHVRAVA